MTFPNFLIIGAPKCGTSSLYSWMLSHPDVCGALVKEPFFLMDREHPIQGTPAYASHGLEAWSQHFRVDAAKYPIRMEATTHYLFQKTALEVVRKLHDIRICIVLRDPAARVLSSFNYAQNNFLRLNGALDFDAYLEIIRRSESLYPQYCDSLSTAFVHGRDLNYSQYSGWVRNWLEELGQDRVKVLIFEELIASPQDALDDLLGWLGLVPWNSAPPTIPRNATYRVRHRKLHKLAMTVKPHLNLLGPLKPTLQNFYLRLQGRNGASAPAIDLNPLRKLFLDDVQRLECLLKRDLSIWYPEELKSSPADSRAVAE